MACRAQDWHATRVQRVRVVSAVATAPPAGAVVPRPPVVRQQAVDRPDAACRAAYQLSNDSECRVTNRLTPYMNWN